MSLAHSCRQSAFLLSMGRCNQKRVASHIRSGRLAAQKVCIISLNAHTLFAVRRSPLSVGSVTLECGHAPTTSHAGSSESFPIASAKQNNTYRRKCDAPFFEMRSAICGRFFARRCTGVDDFCNRCSQKRKKKRARGHRFHWGKNSFK